MGHPCCWGGCIPDRTLALVQIHDQTVLAATRVAVRTGLEPDSGTGFALRFPGLARCSGSRQPADDCHILWSPLFFKLRRPDWALWEVPFLWLSILVPIVLLYPISRNASLLLVPYLAWVSFAAFLNLAIVRLNQPFGG
jgi:hypothetical protein